MSTNRLPIRCYNRNIESGFRTIVLCRQLRAELADDATAAFYRDYGINSRESFEELCDQILQEIESEG